LIVYASKVAVSYLVKEPKWSFKKGLITATNTWSSVKLGNGSLWSSSYFAEKCGGVSILILLEYNGKSKNYGMKSRLIEAKNL
jgi:REP element-mobilizing transposase RayT